MQQPRIEKVTLNIGAGKDQTRLEKGLAVIQAITGTPPVKTVTQKRIPDWGLRPGLPIGCKLTLRKKQAHELLKRLLAAKENKLAATQFDAQGNLAFGIQEHIDIPGVVYNPATGIMGLQVCVTFEKPGYRIKKRKIAQHKIPARHIVTKDEAVRYMQEKFGAKVEP